MNRATFATLKKYAKQNKLFHCIKGEFFPILLIGGRIRYLKTLGI